MTRRRLAILISGRGSNMAAILDACTHRDYPATPVLVVSNRPAAKGLATAETFGVTTQIVDHTAYGADREAFERAMHDVLQAANVEIIALAGFMRVLTPWFVQKWTGRMVNIHPSLLPKYPGLNTHARALAAGDREHGCTVHWVSEGVDAGAIIDQAGLTIAPNDTPESLAQRLLPLEHHLYPAALAKACAALDDP